MFALPGQVFYLVGSGTGRSISATPAFAALVTTISVSGSVQELDFRRRYFESKSFLSVLPDPFARTQSTLDEDFHPLRHVLITCLGQAVPGGDSEPLRLFALLTLRRVATARRNREGCDRIPIRCIPHFRVTSNIADDQNLVQRHSFRALQLHYQRPDDILRSLQVSIKLLCHSRIHAELREGIISLRELLDGEREALEAPNVPILNRTGSLGDPSIDPLKDTFQLFLCRFWTEDYHNFVITDSLSYQIYSCRSHTFRETRDYGL